MAVNPVIFAELLNSMVFKYLWRENVNFWFSWWTKFSIFVNDGF